MKKETKFIVVAKGSFINSSFGEFLNTFYRTQGEEAHFMFGSVPKDGFYVSHGTITKIKSTFLEWKESFEFYSQEGDGQIRKYSIPSRKKTAEEKRVQLQLMELANKKNDK
ncbi:MAG: hypothetical protein WCI36_03270 [bacterium]